MNIINDDDEIKTKINNEIKGETTFNTLKELQNVIKKESALKELYSHTSKTIKDDIEQLCWEIYNKKIDLLNILKNDPKENDIIIYQLIKNNKEYLKQLHFFVPKILTHLWEQPSLIAKILINANKEDIKKYLAPLICNNFYENILSNNYIEDQLIYIIYLLLENEINNLKNINDYQYFLRETPCGYLLEELIDKKDIKAFFKIILKDLIESIEISREDVEFNFTINEIEKNIVNRINQKKIMILIIKIIKLIWIKRLTANYHQFQKIENNTNFFLVNIL